MKRCVLALAAALLLVVGLAGPASAQNIPTVPYRIQPGDSLAKIARMFCTTWQEVFEFNKGYIGSDPNDLRPGTQIYVIDRCQRPPVPPGGATDVWDRGPRLHANGRLIGNVYITAPGDTYYSIGQRFGLPWQEIARANGNPSLFPGLRLIIPRLGRGPVPELPIEPPPSGGPVPELPIEPPPSGGPVPELPIEPPPGRVEYAPGECTVTSIFNVPYYNGVEGTRRGLIPPGRYDALVRVDGRAGISWFLLAVPNQNVNRWITGTDVPLRTGPGCDK